VALATMSNICPVLVANLEALGSLFAATVCVVSSASQFQYPNLPNVYEQLALVDFCSTDLSPAGDGRGINSV
jgi:hypothetical protein